MRSRRWGAPGDLTSEDGETSIQPLRKDHGRLPRRPLPDISVAPGAIVPANLPNTTPSVTHAMEDYLKAVFRIAESGEAVTTQRLAEELGVTGPSVTNMVKRLHELKLLNHTRYQGVELTGAGEKIALEVVRHHRLLELYLAETLGFGWDEVHDEAEKLEHHVSDDLEARMDSALGFPKRDPHGDPIPSREGVIDSEDSISLFDADPGTSATVARVSDRDPEQLRYLARLGMIPGARMTIIERLPFDDVLRVSVAGKVHVVGKHLGASVSVVPD